jgi:anti-sigma B factor antagonist
MSKLDITQRHSANVTILDLSGKIQIGESSINLRTSLRELMREDKKHILLNLSDISHIDSCGLGELVAGFVSAEKNGGELKLLNLTDRVSELMMITKLLTVFEVYENEEEAVSSFQNISENIELNQSAFATGKPD